MLKNKPNRGGKRKGSGRPKGEPTKTIAVRVPEIDYEALKVELNAYAKAYTKKREGKEN
jgi:hypothetical protein